MTDFDLYLKNIIGHSRITETLARAMDQGRFPHALLFAGPDGIGKLRTARSLAARLLMEAVPKEERPRVQERLLHGTHQDCIIMDPQWGVKKASSAIKIEAIRHLEERVRVGAYESDTMVVIIDPAHEMTAGAANAVLKTLEEPPPGTYFFLISSSPDRLLPTIRSRCQTFRFAPLSDHELREILAKSRPDLTLDQISPILAMAEGSARRALDYTDSSDFHTLAALAVRFVQTILAGSMLDILKLSEELGSLDKEIYATLLPLVEQKIREATVTGMAPESAAPVRNYDINGWIETLERGKRDLAGNVNRRLLSEHLLWTMRKL